MQNTSRSSPRQPSSLACVPCRRRHLKCDSLMPVCSRCQTSDLECRYVRSRRGMRSKPDNPPSPLFNHDVPLFDADAFSNWLNNTTLPPDLDAGEALFQSLGTPQTFDMPSLTDDAISWPEPEQLSTPGVAYDPMIQLYYQNFHRSHPLLVPRKALASHLCDRIPAYLLSIMRYIGAHFYPDPAFKEEFRGSAYAIFADSTVRDGFKVQGMLLLAIVEHAHGQDESAHRTMQAAIDLALDLGMHRSSFALENSKGDFMMEESWCRTFWELYVVDGLLATMRDQSSFRLCRQRTDVRLPCAEDAYTSGIAPMSIRQTLNDLERSWSFGQGHCPSSFAYRIHAVQTLGKVMEVNRSLDMDMEARIETVDASLASSLMRLPSSQGSGYDSSDFDELLFQAEMITYIGLIYLHHPRSSMRFASFNGRTSCARLRAARETNSGSADLDPHSQKFLRAADHLSNLATLPNPIQSRTPFFTCALAICIVVHTAASLVVPSAGKVESLKARIQLGFGGLNVLGKVWPLAKTVRQQMVDMYQEVGLR
ncbi:putative C6 transcription factor [Aspergillus steynii IBT 23096]|uniref:Putative C6 transcription factor n=1 Tax=Aspergillus steynii IBT 23096 TaxID=1392250 RepID=A0A2I2GMU8_9EURO|nr:putative C6 transcription factor [Aspergillus steynii IBT 23096]PLB54194.1 putative C6 transcription factor [Aspergillus steynii IBT 23096]